MTFEENMLRLDEIVKMLENDKMPLDKALDCYKEGIELSVECKKILENAKLSVKTVGEVTENEQ